MPRESTSLFSMVGLAAILCVNSVGRANGPSSGALRLDVPVLDIGTSVSIGVQGRPGARYAVLASRFAGVTPSPAGAWCLNLARRYLVLRDSIRGSDPRLDAGGRASITLRVPNAPRLLALPAHFQAVARDAASPNGWTLSNAPSRVIGNGSVGDFSQHRLEIPNDDPAIGPTSALFFDCDGDGDLDLLLGYPGGQRLTGRMKLLLNDGTGQFADGTHGPTTGLPDQPLSVTKLTAGDVDGDGDLDVYVTCTFGVDGQDGQNRLYLNDGRGFFVDGTLGSDVGLPHGDYRDWEGVTFDADLGDLDGDGDLDVILPENAVPGAGRLLINANGHGLFVDGTNGASTHFPLYNDGQARASALGDVDGDGDLDVYMTGYAINRLYLNDGSAVFTDVSSTHLPTLAALTGADVQMADVDADGDLDIVIAADVAFDGGGFGPGTDRLLINDGTGHFTDGTNGATTGLPPIQDVDLSLIVGDVNRDGSPDLVFCSSSFGWGGRNRLYLNDGRGRFIDSTSGPTARLFDVALQQPVGALGDLDGDGDMDLLLISSPSTNPVIVYFND
jgi:VCBS repeat protein